MKMFILKIISTKKPLNEYSAVFYEQSINYRLFLLQFSLVAKVTVAYGNVIHAGG